MKISRCSDERVMRMRPCKKNWCVQALTAPIYRDRQSDGRMGHWGEVQQPGKPTAHPPGCHAGGWKNVPQCVL